MSNTSTSTTYTLTIQGSVLLIGQMILTPQPSVTDALALEIATALKSVSWPAGTTLQVQKDAVTDVSYQVDFTATPLTFT